MLFNVISRLLASPAFLVVTVAPVALFASATDLIYPDKSAPVFLSINFTSVVFGAIGFPVYATVVFTTSALRYSPIFEAVNFNGIILYLRVNTPV